MQVFDLKDVKPHEFVQYGLKCLEMLAGIGDSCAKDTRERLRVVVCYLYTNINQQRQQHEQSSLGLVSFYIIRSHTLSFVLLS